MITKNVMQRHERCWCAFLQWSVPGTISSVCDDGNIENYRGYDDVEEESGRI